MATTTHIQGFGDPELDALQRLVDETAVESNAWYRLLGLLTAVASAPSAILAGDWVHEAHVSLTLCEANRERAWSLTLRLFTELCGWLDQGTAVTPPPDDVAAVDAFCRGYADGIVLDPHWSRSPGLLALAKPMVVLGGMRAWSQFAPWIGEDAPAGWAEEARRQLPHHVLDVYEAMRASGAHGLGDHTRRVRLGERL